MDKPLNLGSVNGQRVKGLDKDGTPLVNCPTCKGKGSYASGQVRGWRNQCVSCGGVGLYRAHGEWKKPKGPMPALCGLLPPTGTFRADVRLVPCICAAGHGTAHQSGQHRWVTDARNQTWNLDALG